MLVLPRRQYSSNDQTKCLLVTHFIMSFLVIIIIIIMLHCAYTCYKLNNFSKMWFFIGVSACRSNPFSATNHFSYSLNCFRLSAAIALKASRKRRNEQKLSLAQRWIPVIGQKLCDLPIEKFIKRNIGIWIVVAVEKNSR